MGKGESSKRHCYKISNGIKKISGGQTPMEIESLSSDTLRTLNLLKSLQNKEKVAIGIEDLDTIKTVSEELSKVKEDEDKKLSNIAKIQERITKQQEQLTEAYKTLDLRLLYMDNPEIYFKLTGTSPVKATTNGNSKKASDNPDQEEMLKAITEENIKEAIADGVDSSKNTDILRWIAKNKLNKEEIKINQSLRTKVYSIRKGLGY